MRVVFPWCTDPHLRTLPGKECLNFIEFPGPKVKASGPGHAPYLAGSPRADNGAGYGQVAHHPGDSHLARRAPVTVADGPQQAHQLQVVGELRLAKVAMAPPPIVSGQ